MSNDSLVYEVARMFSDKTAMARDMDEAANMVKNMFHQKYVKKVTDAVEIQKQKASQNPSKEVELLKAIRPYINQNSHQNLDYMIQALNTVEMVKNIQNEIQESNHPYYVQAKKNDDVIHEDGVYEMDSHCLRNTHFSGNKMANIFLLLSLLKM